MGNRKSEGNPKNLYKRGDSWVIDFYFRGERYTEAIGLVSRTIAKEKAEGRKTAAAEGRLIVMEDGGTARSGSSRETAKVEDLLFEEAMKRYLEWYQANRGAYTYRNTPRRLRRPSRLPSAESASPRSARLPSRRTSSTASASRTPKIRIANR